MPYMPFLGWAPYRRNPIGRGIEQAAEGIAGGISDAALWKFRAQESEKERTSREKQAKEERKSRERQAEEDRRIREQRYKNLYDLGERQLGIEERRLGIAEQDNLAAERWRRMNFWNQFQNNAVNFGIKAVPVDKQPEYFQKLAELGAGILSPVFSNITPTNLLNNYNEALGKTPINDPTNAVIDNPLRQQARQTKAVLQKQAMAPGPNVTEETANPLVALGEMIGMLGGPQAPVNIQPEVSAPDTTEMRPQDLISLRRQIVQDISDTQIDLTNTKAPPDPATRFRLQRRLESLNQQLEAIDSRLGISTGPEEPVKTAEEAIRRIVREGAARKVDISNLGPVERAVLRDWLQRHKEYQQ